MSITVVAQGDMMGHWHHKLQNNTSPDDVIMCEALPAYINADMGNSAYWSTLHWFRTWYPSAYVHD